MRWCLAQAGLRPQDLDAVALLLRPRAGQARRGHGARRPLGPPAAARTPSGARRSSPPRCRASTRRRCGSSRTTSRTPPRPALAAPVATGSAASSCSTAAASGPRTSPGRYVDGRLDVLAAQELPHSLGPALRVAHRAPRVPALQRRVQGDGAGLLRPPAVPRRAARDCVRATATAGSSRRGPDWSRWAAARGRRRRHVGPGARRPRRARCRHGSRRCSSSWPAGCTSDRRPDADHGGRHGAQLRRQLAASGARRRSRTSGCSRPPATPGTALGAALQLSPPTRRRRVAEPMPRRGARPRLERRRARGLAAPAGGAVHAPPTTSPARSPTCSPPTGSSPGSTGAASSDRARSATGRCWRIPATPRTSSGSTTSRAASSSARSRRWCCADRAPRDLLRRADARARTCCSCTTCAPSGGTASRPSCTSTARPASRRSTDGDAAAAGRAAAGLRAPDRAAGRDQHQPQHRGPAHGGRPRRTRSSCSAPRRSTCWSSARTWCAARPSPRRGPA